MDITRWVVLLSIFVFIFGLYQAVDAKVLDTSIVDFDQQTLLRGYTVQSLDNDFQIPIFPKQFKNKLLVKINNETEFEDLPADKELVSDVYVYDLQTEQKGFLNKPVMLILKLQDSIDSNQQIYFYDNCQNKWRVLPTKIDTKNNLAKAWTVFPYAKVALLENKKINKETVKVLADDNLTAKSAFVLDKNSNDKIFAKDENTPRSIASLTKLMSVLVFLQNNPGWDKVVTMQKSDFVGGASLWVKAGDQLTVREIFNSVLVGSHNNSVHALVRSTGMTMEEFVHRMNLYAQELNLKNTYFVEPTGLDERNISTAEELATIAKLAFNHLEVLQASTSKFYTVKLLNSKLTYPIKNTNFRILQKDLYVTGSKTGWTYEAGHCLITQAKDKGKELIVVVLDAPVYKNYEDVYNLFKKYL